MLRLAFDKYRMTFTEEPACECMEWLTRKQSKCNIEIFAQGQILPEIYLLQHRQCHSDILDPKTEVVLAAGINKKQKFLFQSVQTH